LVIGLVLVAVAVLLFLSGGDAVATSGAVALGALGVTTVAISSR
jgi:hypothetical protein